jgi:hypothetical protein
MESATVAAGVVEAPVPVSATVCEEFAALSVKVSVPVRVPDAVGVNERLTVQLDPGATATLVLQVPRPAKPKSPVIENGLGKLRDAVPTLVTVTYCTELVEPTLTLPKFKDVEESETAGELLAHVRANALVAPPKSKARTDAIAKYERF